jgi:hypothetical protein
VSTQIQQPQSRQAANPQLSPQARHVVVGFGQQAGVTPLRAKQLEYLVDHTSYLIDQVNHAVATGNLHGFVPQDPSVKAGGTYQPTTRQITVPVEMLDNPGDAVFVLGHEVQHALNRPAVDRARQQFPLDVHQKVLQGSRDYTEPAANLMAAQRRDEASANLAGWNALVSHVRSYDPNASMAHIAAQTWRTQDVVQVQNGNYVARPDIGLQADASALFTAANIEGMAKNFVDKPNSGLGHHGDSDYANYYGAAAVSNVCQAHRHYFPPQPGKPEQPLELNLSVLKINRQQLERNGIDLGAKHQQPAPYLDTSTNPPIQEQFHHTVTTHSYQPVQAPTPGPLIRQDQQTRQDRQVRQDQQESQLDAAHAAVRVAGMSNSRSATVATTARAAAAEDGRQSRSPGVGATARQRGQHRPYVPGGRDG